MLSDTAEYALRAVLYIADSGKGGSVPVDVVAESLGLPRNYLSKTLNQLAKTGILNSQRGPHGGFKLAMPSEELMLIRIVEPFDELGLRQCLLGRKACSDVTPCPAHAQWKAVADQIAGFFGRTSVADLLREPERMEALKPVR